MLSSSAIHTSSPKLLSQLPNAHYHKHWNMSFVGKQNNWISHGYIQNTAKIWPNLFKFIKIKEALHLILSIQARFLNTVENIFGSVIQFWCKISRNFYTLSASFMVAFSRREMGYWDTVASRSLHTCTLLPKLLWFL